MGATTACRIGTTRFVWWLSAEKKWHHTILLEPDGGQVFDKPTNSNMKKLYGLFKHQKDPKRKLCPGCGKSRALHGVDHSRCVEALAKKEAQANLDKTGIARMSEVSRKRAVDNGRRKRYLKGVLPWFAKD